MIKIIEKHNCSGCHACKAVCPKSCITMVEDNEGFKYPKVDSKKCVECGLCEKACPVLHKTTQNDTPTAYAAINTNDKIRECSSSGGVFYLLAEYVISKGGVVFGAKFDENFDVVHGFAQTIEEATAFMGSKYTQSNMNDNFTQVRDFLNAGRLVLFTGTPCQIAGLKSFLKTERDNLICQDIICHGVPAPIVWNKYRQFRELCSESNIKQCYFRYKNNAWKSYSIFFEFSNGTEFEETHRKDLFMLAFLKNMCLRPSCYHCSFKSKTRSADITLADFWGIQNVLPDMDDDKGTSLVVIHTEKGKQIFEIIKQNLKYMSVDLDEAVKYNPSMIKSVNERPERKRFISEIQKKRFDKVVMKYCYPKPTILSRIKNKIKRIVKR